MPTVASTALARLAAVAVVAVLSACANGATDDAAAPTPTIASEQAGQCEAGQVPCNDGLASEVVPETAPDMAGMCAEGATECDDILDVPSDDGAGGAAGACLRGATECADDPSQDFSPPGPPGGIEVEARDDLVDVRSVPWIDITPTDQDQDALRVTWEGGTTDCSGLDRVEVDEQADAVVVTVFVGRVPGDVVCTEEVVVTSTTVQLAEPLGPRSLVDGVAG